MLAKSTAHCRIYVYIYICTNNLKSPSLGSSIQKSACAKTCRSPICLANTKHNGVTQAPCKTN